MPQSVLIVRAAECADCTGVLIICAAEVSGLFDQVDESSIQWAHDSYHSRRYPLHLCSWADQSDPTLVPLQPTSPLTRALSSLALSLCDCACTLPDNFVLVWLRLLCLDSTVIWRKPYRCAVTKGVVLGVGAPTEHCWSGCHAACVGLDESQARMAGRCSQMVSSIPHYHLLTARSQGRHGHARRVQQHHRRRHLNRR